MTLFSFDDIPILLQYLYMSEEHKILIHNAINVPLEIFIVTDEKNNISFGCRNLNFPELPPMNYTDDAHPETLLRIISQLKKEKAVQFPQRFDNRWEEIKEITLTNLSLNKLYYERSVR